MPAGRRLSTCLPTRWPRMQLGSSILCPRIRPLATGNVFTEIEAKRRLILFVRDADRLLGAVQLGFPAHECRPSGRGQNLIIAHNGPSPWSGHALMLAAEEASLARGAG